ncbi:MAG: NAD(P) transhydrogenase subunit alpha [Planctomycetota bacterium]
MDPFIAAVVVFVLAVFIGFEVITKVPSTLHTPLMSGSNAISGITLVGALMCSFHDTFFSVGVVLGFLAMIAATINVVGGYAVTDRMLKMFIKEDK